MNLYENKSSNAKRNAQSNLMGRTHYVDDDSLRFHKARILSARHTDGGLLFAIVESTSADYKNTRRGFRFVIFDIDGTVIERANLDGMYSTSKSATKAMWAALNTMNAHQITLDAIARKERNHKQDMDELRRKLATMQVEKEAA